MAVTDCYTPDEAHRLSHYTAVPKHAKRVAEFCATMTRRCFRR